MAPVISIEGLDDFGVVLSNLRPLQQASRAGTKALYDGRTACLTFQASPGFNCNAIVCLRLLSWSHPGDLDVEQRQGTSGPASTSESEREGRGERGPSTPYMLKLPRGTAPATDPKASFHQQGREGGGGVGVCLQTFPLRKEGRKEERERLDQICPRAIHRRTSALEPLVQPYVCYLGVSRIRGSHAICRKSGASSER